MNASCSAGSTPPSAISWPRSCASCSPRSTTTISPDGTSLARTAHRWNRHPCAHVAGSLHEPGPGRQGSGTPPADDVQVSPDEPGRHPRPAGPASAAPAMQPPYYLALGDSLSQGIQPGPTGADEPTDQGYPDQLATLLRAQDPDLRLVKLGCSGETTWTMIHGGTCQYPRGSQLSQATSLPAHASRPGRARHHRHRRQRPELLRHRPARVPHLRLPVRPDRPHRAQPQPDPRPASRRRRRRRAFRRHDVLRA